MLSSKEMKVLWEVFGGVVRVLPLCDPNYRLHHFVPLQSFGQVKSSILNMEDPPLPMS